MFTVDFRFEENQTTIEFPCNEEFLSAKFDELGVEDKLKTSQYMIGTNYAALKWLVTDFVDVDELNFLAKCLDSFDKNELNNLWFERIQDITATESIYAANNVLRAVERAEKNNELDKLEAVIDFADRYDSASIIKLEDNIDNFRYFDNVYDKEGLGRALIDENDDYYIDEDIEEFFMFEQYAESVMDECDCKFCDNGAVLLEGLTLAEILGEDNQSEEMTMGGM